MNEQLNQKIGLLIEYYSGTYENEEVLNIIKEIQDLYDFGEENEQNLKPLLQKLYTKIVKREFHSDLLEELLKELEEKD